MLGPLKALLNTCERMLCGIPGQSLVALKKLLVGGTLREMSGVSLKTVTLSL